MTHATRERRLNLQMGRALRYIYVTNDTKQDCLLCRFFGFVSAGSRYSMLPLKWCGRALATTRGQLGECELHGFDNKNVYKGSCFRAEILTTMFWWLSPNDMKAQALEHFFQGRWFPASWQYCNGPGSARCGSGSKGSMVCSTERCVLGRLRETWVMAAESALPTRVSETRWLLTLRLVLDQSKNRWVEWMQPQSNTFWINREIKTGKGKGRKIKVCSGSDYCYSESYQCFLSLR